MCSRGGRREGALWGLFYKGSIPLVRVSPSGPNHLPKPPLPIPSTYGFGGNTTPDLQHVARGQAGEVAGMDLGGPGKEREEVGLWSVAVGTPGGL